MSIAKNVKAKKKKPIKGRFEFQADPVLFRRAESFAKRLGLSLAGYIRYVLIEDMERRERNDIS